MFSLLTKIFGDPSEKKLRSYQEDLEKIKAVESRYKSDIKNIEQVQAKTHEFQSRFTWLDVNNAEDLIQIREELESIKHEAIALHRRACELIYGQEFVVNGEQKITWNMIPYDVQIIGALALHEGNIAEMRTGEGKTLVATLPAYLNALSIVASGTNLNVTGTVGVSTNTGIYQTGAITNNAPGSNISFISNGIINQTGAIAVVANTTGTAASITYDATSDGRSSSITTGALTIASGTNNSPINYIIKASGAAINPGAIGSSTVALPGYVLLDNTYGCSGTGCVPVTGFINATTNNLASLATSSIGVTINNAIFATGNITANGASNTSMGCSTP